MSITSKRKLNHSFGEIYPAIQEIISEPIRVRDMLKSTGYWLAPAALIAKYNLPPNDLPTDWEKGIHEEDREQTIKDFTRNIKNKSVTTFRQEYRFKGADRFYFIHENVKVERDVNGNPLRCLSVWKDITDLQEIEPVKRNKQKNNFYRADKLNSDETIQTHDKKWHENAEALSRVEFILNKSQQITKTGSWEIDLRTEKFSCSNEFYAIHGMNRNFNLKDRDLFLALYEVETGVKIMAGLEQLKQEGLPLDITFPFITVIGGRRWFRLIAYPFYHKETMTEITGVVHDITAFKETEERLRASEEKFFTLFKFTPDFMSLARESDGVIVEVNDKALAVCGYTEEEMVGKQARDLNLWANPKELEEFFVQYSKDSKASAEVSWKKKGGQLLYIMISSVRVKISAEYYRLSLVKDITARKKAEEKFNAAFNLNPDLMAILREDDETVEDVNENVIEMLGISREEIIGKSTAELNLWVYPEERQRYFQQYRKGNKVLFEAKWRKKNGQELYVLISAVRIQLYDELFILTSIKDITQRMQAEKIFQTVFRSSPDMMAIIRQRDATIVDINDRVYSSIGFKREELIGQQTQDLDIWFKKEERVQADLNAVTTITYETRLRSKSGKEVFVLVSSSMIDIFGEPHVLFITKDITDRKKAEDKLRYSEANLSATINNASMTIWSMDINYILLAQNEASRRYTQERFGKCIEVGESLQVFDQVADKKTIAFWDEKFKQVFKGEQVHCFLEEFNHYYEISINPIRDSENIVGLTVFSMDITDRIAREREVVKNLEQLAEAERRIGELKLMSLRSAMNPHFIFNALNSIQFFISKNERAQAIQYLATFSKLIRGILTGSAQNRTRLAEELDLLKHYLDLEKLRFENKFIVEFNVDPKVDKENIEVPSLLIQPFVENAILHGLSNRETGGVLKISIHKQKNEHIVFEVEDNGIGREAAKKIQHIRQKHHKSMGISLAEERLKMINGDAQLSVETEDLYSAGKPAGTRVRIWFQLQ
jgi:PAS domain S-box-containing protein